MIFNYTIKRMQRYFRLFFALMVLEAIFTPLAIMAAYLTGSNLFFNFPKFPLILMFLLVVFFALNFKLKLNFTSVVFLIIFPFSFFYGGGTNEMSKPFFSHIYGVVMPIFCVSFGMFFAHYSTDKTREQIFTLFNKSYKYLVFIILSYFALYKVGIINYFGMSTYTAYFVALFSSVNNLVGAFFALVLTLFTGKRAILLGGLIILIVYLFFSKESGKQSAKLKFMKVGIIFILPLSIVVAWQMGVLNRFENTINVDASDERSLYMATGGRSLEIYTIVSHINNEKIWLTGGGFGETYLLPELDDLGTVRKMHYSHMSPLYLTLVYGMPFMFIIYTYFFYIVIKGLMSKKINFFYLSFVMLFSTAFAGSVIFVDPKFWVFLGCVVGSYKYKTDLYLK